MHFDTVHAGFASTNIFNKYNFEFVTPYNFLDSSFLHKCTNYAQDLNATLRKHSKVGPSAFFTRISVYL